MKTFSLTVLVLLLYSAQVPHIAEAKKWEQHDQSTPVRKKTTFSAVIENTSYIFEEMKIASLCLKAFFVSPKLEKVKSSESVKNAKILDL